MITFKIQRRLFLSVFMMMIGFTVSNFSTSICGAERCSSRRNPPFGCVCDAMFCRNCKNQSKSVRGIILLQERSRSQWHRIWIWWRTLCQCVCVHNSLFFFFCLLLLLFFSFYFDMIKSNCSWGENIFMLQK